MHNLTHSRTAAALLTVAFTAAIPVVTTAKTAVTKPHVKNVVLVHGAWGDGGGWQGVYNILVRDGYNVSIVTHSNKSLASDVEDTQRVLDRQGGPVILVGHSYGGAVISEAGVDPKVVGLVYVAAFAPDIGESVLGQYPKDSPPLPVDVSKDGMSFFKRDAYIAAFAPDVPKAQVEFMAASQVPFSVKNSGLAPLTNAAWKNNPSWYLLYKNDQLVPPALAHMMAQRAKATIVEAPGSHAGFIAHPAAAAKIIEQAAEAEAK